VLRSVAAAAGITAAPGPHTSRLEQFQAAHSSFLVVSENPSSCGGCFHDISNLTRDNASVGWEGGWRGGRVAGKDGAE